MIHGYDNAVRDFVKYFATRGEPNGKLNLLTGWVNPGDVTALKHLVAEMGIDATVLEIIYMGDILRARLRVAGQDDFVMKYRNTLGQVKLAPGQNIRIGWHPEDARALDPV